MKKIYTKASLIAALHDIRNMGWIESHRHGNAGGIGNTLEDLLGIEENNLPIPNASEWELKCQRSKTASLTTLMHMEPSPRTLSLVSSLLLPKYGWAHQQSGLKYSEAEMSFRATINALGRTDRGFGIKVNHVDRRVEVSFDYQSVNPRHKEWIDAVNERVGLQELEPQPYWGFDDLFHKAGTKLNNCFYIRADVKKIEGKEYYAYREIFMLRGFSQSKFIAAIEAGKLLVDFDARTGHNHGTKFRLVQNCMPDIYDHVDQL
jgi:hypothetical protein